MIINKFAINPQKWHDEISKCFTWLRVWVGMENNSGRFDVNKTCETLFIPILNTIYGWSLKNVNSKVTNVAGYDLELSGGDVVVQVTSITSRDKVRDAIQKTADSRPNSTLYMLYIGESPLKKGWTNQTFKAPAKNYVFPFGKINFSCPDNLITYEVILKECDSDPETLEAVYSICQKYFGATSRNKQNTQQTGAIDKSRQQTYDMVLKHLSFLSELLNHVDLVRDYCKEYCEGGSGIYRWSPIHSIMNNQIRRTIQSTPNVILQLKGLLVTETDAYQGIVDLDALMSKLLGAADTLEQLPCRVSNDYTPLEMKQILREVKVTYKLLDDFWRRCEQVIQTVISRTTNPSGSADLFLSWA